jgi:hypothetical protein
VPECLFRIDRYEYNVAVSVAEFVVTVLESEHFRRTYNREGGWNKEHYQPRSRSFF